MTRDLRRKVKDKLAMLRMCLSGRNVEAVADRRVRRTRSLVSQAKDGSSSEKSRMSGGKVSRSAASNRVLRDLGGGGEYD